MNYGGEGRRAPHWDEPADPSRVLRTHEIAHDAGTRGQRRIVDMCADASLFVQAMVHEAAIESRRESLGGS